MNQTSRNLRWSVVGVVSALVMSLPSLGISAEVTTEPSVLVYHNTGQAETVKLFSAGQPLSAYAITGWLLMVDERAYSHMLRITPTDAGLRITPSDTVEVGSYELVISTPQGNATVQVFTPLSDHQSSLELLAQRMNIGIEEVRKQAGLSQRLGRDKITLGLLPVYYLGQRIQITMPGADSRSYTWTANGKTVQEGIGAHYFEHVADETGPLLFGYEEKEGDAIAATAAALVEIAREPAISHTVKVGARARFEAPNGFSDYVWLMEGSQLGTGGTFEYTFQQPGKYHVEVRATSPTAPVPYAFRETRYDVTVTQD